MASYEGIISRMRLELGDEPEYFQTRAEGDGSTTSYDVPVGFVDPQSIDAFTVSGDVGDPITTGSPDRTALVAGTDYTFNAKADTINLITPVAEGTFLFVEGTSVHVYTDAELMLFINDAIALHFGANGGPVVKEVHRYRTSNGFIRFRDTDSNIYNMSNTEAVPVQMLAMIQALWALSIDATTDIDIISAEGTNIPRTQRFSQLRTQIDAMTARYKELCAMLGVGMYAAEVLPMRRVSKRTGRLIPIYQEREFDDATYPVRRLPPVSERNADPHGPPSPVIGLNWY